MVGRDNGGKEGRVFRNKYKGHMDKIKGGGIRRGRWGWLGLGRVVGGDGDNCLCTTIKIIINFKK